jgi:hypothetical protein
MSYLDCKAVYPHINIITYTKCQKCRLFDFIQYHQRNTVLTKFNSPLIIFWTILCDFRLDQYILYKGQNRLILIIHRFHQLENRCFLVLSRCRRNQICGSFVRYQASKYLIVKSSNS